MTAVPPITLTYFDAANRRDFDAVAACFTLDAVVRDEGRDHVGRAAIRAWKVDVTGRYMTMAEVTGAEQVGDRIVVAARVSGNFPGSPAVLHYAFEIEAGLIRRLGIA